MITIGRVKQFVAGAENVYIGRGSPLGNPWPISARMSRDKVCDLYDEYLRKAVKDKSTPQYKEMVRLFRMHQAGININLQCFCTPNRCHGETIRAIILEAFEKMQNK